jgi:hypothetical protein
MERNHHLDIELHTEKLVVQQALANATDICPDVSLCPFRVFSEKQTSRMKYSEVIHTNKEFDEKAAGGRSSAMRRGATDNTGQRVIRDERGDSICKTPLSTQNRVRLVDFTTVRSSTTCKVSP